MVPVTIPLFRQGLEFGPVLQVSEISQNSPEKPFGHLHLQGGSIWRPIRKPEFSQGFLEGVEEHFLGV